MGSRLAPRALVRRRIKKRYQEITAVLPNLNITISPFHALRESLRQGYGRRHLISDVLAGIVVGIVALPLSMALAVASGVPPQYGLYTAIVGGALIALLGGSRVNVSGPTAAFVVILAPISEKFGLAGLLVATLMAGVILVIMGLARMGRLVEFIPHPVTTGFTAGIAVVIASIQLKDFFGLRLHSNPESFVERLEAYGHAASTFRGPDVAIGVLTLAVMIGWPRVTRRVPAPLVALVVGAIAAAALHQWIGGVDVDTINSRFSYSSGGSIHAGIPQVPPTPVLPWTLPGPANQPIALTWSLFQDLLPSAFAIAMLGAIESLLCAVVADGMAGTRHDPDTELVAQGVGNIVAPFFGGIAATAAIARTATAIRAGACSPIASIVHSLFVLVGVVALGSLLGYIPMASLAALLLIVAWNMSEVKHFFHILRVAPRSDVLVLLACFSTTIIFDMVVAVTVGILLAAVLFMRRMAGLAYSRLLDAQTHEIGEDVPRGCMVYEIAGPLFFGAAQKAMRAVETISNDWHTVVIDMSAVPAIDVTGLVALESAIADLTKHRIEVILADVQAQPRKVLDRSEVFENDRVSLAASMSEAFEAVRRCHGDSSSPR